MNYIGKVCHLKKKKVFHFFFISGGLRFVIWFDQLQSQFHLYDLPVILKGVS